MCSVFNVPFGSPPASSVNGEGFPSSDPRQGSSSGTGARASKNMGNATAPYRLLPPSMFFFNELKWKKKKLLALRT